MRAAAGEQQLTCVDLEFSRKSGFTLGPIACDFPRGLTSVVGENGAGKSTLFSLLVGQLRPSSGDYTLQGGNGVGYLPQAMIFPEHATVGDYMTYVAWIYGVRRRRRADAVAQALEVTDLTERTGQKIKSLSGGMQRRLGIAQAIVARPALLLLDEPTAGLDPLQRVRLRQLIERLAQERIVLMSTHLADDVSGLSHKVVVLRDGSLVFEGTPAQIEELSVHGGIGGTAFERGLTYAMAGCDD